MFRSLPKNNKKKEETKKLNIVLFEPEIPFNTAAIGRSAVLTNSKLHLIKPLGFSLSDKAIKKAGLDYWDKIDLKIYSDFNEFLGYNKGRLFFATTKAKKFYTEYEYKEGDFFIFGPESRGLPKDILDDYKDNLIKIPMTESMERSLNLSNSVAVILFEALRQTGFNGLK